MLWRTKINYRNLSPQIVTKLDEDLSVSKILNWIKNETIEAFSLRYANKLEVGALNNMMGRWNELIATTLLSKWDKLN